MPMKSYYTGESVRLTGKAWEIRHYLRKAAAGVPRRTTLADWLAGGRSTGRRRR